MTTHSGSGRGEGSTRTRLRADGVACTRMEGFITAELIVAMHEDVVRTVEGAERVWYVHTLGITGFDPRLAVPGRAFLADLRERGISIVAAMNNPAVRMMARGLCFGAGVPLYPFETAAEAEARVGELVGA